jgi:hypothetical protein
MHFLCKVATGVVADVPRVRARPPAAKGSTLMYTYLAACMPLVFMASAVS